jgi:putative spermidine/putrescine transport system permease protein
MVVPTVTVALGLYLYFSQLGLVGTTTGLILAHSVLTTPFTTVMAASGIRQTDINVELAARLMGASPAVVMRRVVLPQIMPSIVASALFAFLLSFDEVVISWFITDAATTTLPVVMYGSLKFEMSPVIAATSSMLSLISIAICIAAASLMKRPHPMATH